MGGGGYRDDCLDRSTSSTVSIMAIVLLTTLPRKVLGKRYFLSDDDSQLKLGA